MTLLLVDTERKVWVSEVEVTQAMLDAGNVEVVKVAEERGLSFALKMFSQETIDAILTEGFQAMFRAQNQKKKE